MPIIKITTKIEAPIIVVFDLARSVDLHKISTKQTNETAIAGVRSGLMELNDSVTWKAKHLGIYQTLTSKITSMERPYKFVDEMVQGAFKSFKHSHGFEIERSMTTMTDVFDYESPFGLLGKLADTLFLEKYMTKLLAKRNQVIKEFAESEDWKLVLKESNG